MQESQPSPANEAYAFSGEDVPPRRLLTPALAKTLLEARNPTGKPNRDVLREAVGVDPARRVRRRWMLDFPPQMSVAEAALYTGPFRVLRQRGLRPDEPSRNGELRNALARIDRYLAAPVASPTPAFAWMEAELVPDDSLIVWARDDDFSAGVLASEKFRQWWTQHPPLAALRTFQFPWPPGTPLSALTRDQEEHRHAIARAARREDQAAIDEAVERAYAR